MTDKLTRCEQVWYTITCIPEGNVASYGQIADLAGLPGRARFVGTCLKQTPKEKVLPWHRVLRSSGELAFPKGSEQAQEQMERLREEGVAVNNNRVKMAQFQWVPDMATLLGTLKF